MNDRDAIGNEERILSLKRYFVTVARGRIFAPGWITPESLALWVAAGNADFGRNTRQLSFSPGRPRRNDDRYAAFRSASSSNDVAALLGEYVRRYIPAPELLEDDYWVATLPTQRGVLARINAGPVHLAAVCGDDDMLSFTRLWMAASPLGDLDHPRFKELSRACGAELVQGPNATQRAGGPDQVSFVIADPADTRRFINDGMVAEAIRLYNAMQVIHSKTRWHDAHVPALVDLAFR